MKLILLTTKKDFRAAINLINKQQSNSSNLFNTINDKSAMTQEQVYELFYTAACYMGVNRHKKAMGLLYDFISEEKNLTKRDAYTTARFFYLIVLIEINDDGLINSELRSLQRFLKAEKKLFKFEKVFLRFISGLLTKNTTAQIRYHYRQLNDDLSLLKELPFERNAFVYYDFIGWVESKIRK